MYRMQQKIKFGSNRNKQYGPLVDTTIAFLQYGTSYLQEKTKKVLYIFCKKNRKDDKGTI